MTDTKKLPNYLKFLFSAIAGSGGIIACYPSEFLKTRLQVLGMGQKTAPMTTIQLMKHIYKTDGFPGLYTGLTASVLRQILYTGSRMGAFQVMMDRLSKSGDPISLSTKVACGIASGIMGGIIGLPPDVALTRMAADGGAPPDKRRNYTHVFNAMSRIYKEDGGITALYRGVTPTVVRAIADNTSQLVSYSQSKEILLKYGLLKDNTTCHVICSLFAAFMVTLCVLPTDITKTRIQNQRIVNGIPEYTSMLDVWQQIISKEGILALWKGFPPFLVKNSAQSMVMFVIFENLTKFYKIHVLHEEIKE